MDELTVNFSCSSGSSSQHTIYCKRHNVRQPSNLTPNNRTLFTTGWPPYCSINEIKELFSRAVGQIEDVFLQESTGSVDENKPLSGGYMVGYIVFHEESDVTRALSLCSEEIAPLNCCIGETGLKKWCHEYQENYQSENILEKGSKMGVTAYDEWLEKERKRKKHLSEPDEEGWVTVTKKTPITTAHRLVGIMYASKTCFVLLGQRKRRKVKH